MRAFSEPTERGGWWSWRRVLVLCGAAFPLLAPGLRGQTGALPDSPPTSPHEAPETAPSMRGAGSEDVPLLTLGEAVRLATATNPQYQSAKLQALEQLEQYRAQRTQFFPALYTFALYDETLSRFNFTIPLGFLGNYPGTGQIPSADVSYATPRKPISLGAGYASQPLTSLIRLHYSIGAQREMAESMGFRAELMRQRQITNVKQAYTRVRSSEVQAESSAASVAAARETSRIAHVRRDQGELLLSQMESSDALLANAESQQQQDADQVAQNKERLNQMLGRDVMAPFTTEAVEERSRLEDMSEEALRSLALERRPELKQDEASIRANELQVKATRAMYIPDVSASVEYLGVLTNTYGLPHNLGIAGAQMTWEPWDWGRKRHQAEAQRASVQQSRVQRDQDRNQVIADVNQAARVYRQRHTQMHAMEMSAKAARTNLLETQEQVKNGTALMASLLQAQTGDATAQTQLATARNNLYDAEAQMEQAVGEVQ